MCLLMPGLLYHAGPREFWDSKQQHANFQSPSLPRLKEQLRVGLGGVWRELGWDVHS